MKKKFLKIWLGFLGQWEHDRGMLFGELYDVIIRSHTLIF